MTTKLAIETFAYAPAWGVATAYSIYGMRPIPLIAGGLLAMPAFTLGNSLGRELPSAVPSIVATAIPEMVAGGLIGLYFGGGQYGYAGAAVGAAAGVAIKKFYGDMLANQIGFHL